MMRYVSLLKLSVFVCGVAKVGWNSSTKMLYPPLKVLKGKKRFHKLFVITAYLSLFSFVALYNKDQMVNILTMSNEIVSIFQKIVKRHLFVLLLDFHRYLFLLTIQKI